VILQEVRKISAGDLIKRSCGHRRGQIALVIAEGADKYQVILRNWIRIQYISRGDYEWVKKEAVEILTRDQ
tara:strand:- start:180 stop:392 length:213 start_codon:yes stop_codon:yes gene_type:complete